MNMCFYQNYNTLEIYIRIQYGLIILQLDRLIQSTSL